MLISTKSNEPLQTPGATLRAAREQAKITRESVAQALLIKLDRIQALEEDSCDLLCDDVYIRGYLRSYAKFLNLDGEDLVCLFDESREGKGDCLAHPLGRPKRVNKYSMAFIIVSFSCVILFYLMVSRYDSPGNDMSAPGPAVERIASIREDFSSVERQVVSVPDDGLGTTINDVVDVSVIENTIALAPAPSVLQNTSAQTAVGYPVLYLSFAKECWLEVRTATGTVLSADLQMAGSDVRLTGEPPFKIKLGHTEGVKITLNNEVVAVPRVTDGKVVNLTVAMKASN